MECSPYFDHRLHLMFLTSVLWDGLEGSLLTLEPSRTISSPSVVGAPRWGLIPPQQRGHTPPPLYGDATAHVTARSSFLTLGSRYKLVRLVDHHPLCCTCESMSAAGPLELLS